MLIDYTRLELHEQEKEEKLSFVESDAKKCVESALDKIGPRLKYSVYLKEAQINSQTPGKASGILESPDSLVAALQAIFGLGAKPIEQKIMNEIRLRIGKPFAQATDLPTLIRSIKAEEQTAQPTLVTVIIDLFPY